MQCAPCGVWECAWVYRTRLPLGVMFFQLDDCTLTATQILELLDKNRLDREGIRALAEA